MPDTIFTNYTDSVTKQNSDVSLSETQVNLSALAWLTIGVL